MALAVSGISQIETSHLAVSILGSLHGVFILPVLCPCASYLCTPFPFMSFITPPQFCSFYLSAFNHFHFPMFHGLNTTSVVSRLEHVDRKTDVVLKLKRSKVLLSSVIFSLVFATPGATTINVFRACLGAQLTICASLRFVSSRVCVFLYSLGPCSCSYFFFSDLLNIQKSKILHPQFYLYRLVFHKVQFWDQYYLLYM